MSQKKLEGSSKEVGEVLTAEGAVQALRALAQRLPVTETEGPVDRTRKSANVDPRFTAAAINVVGAVPEVSAALGQTDVQLREASEEAVRWTAAIVEARVLLRRLEDEDVRRRQRVGLTSLQAYQICRQLVRNDAHKAALAPHLAALKRLNRFGKAKAQTAPPEPQPQPQPQTA